MSDQDNNNDNKTKDPLTTAILAERAALGVEKAANIRAIKAISNDSKWHLLQEIMQEICAKYVVELADKPTAMQLTEDLRNEIKSRYDNDEEKRELLLKAIPNWDTLRRWQKAEGWDDAVWEKAKSDGIFSKERKAQMILAVYNRGLARSDSAAKLYLQMSGEYSERADGEKDRVADTFREINKLLHKKNG